MQRKEFTIRDVCQAFGETLSCDEKIRTAAEKTLQTFTGTNGFLIMLTTILSDANVDASVRASVAVFLKNQVKDHWNGDSSESKYSQTEKTAIRNSVLRLLEILYAINPGHATMNSVKEMLRLISSIDFPDSWPAALPEISQRVRQRENINAIRAAILLLKEIVSFFYSDPVGKKVIEATFSDLMVLARDLITSDCLSDYTKSEIMMNVCKIFRKSDRILMKHLDKENFTLLLQLLEEFLALKIPADVLKSLKSNTDDQEEKIPQLEIKKSCARILLDILLSRKSQQSRNNLFDIFLESWASKFAIFFVDELEQRSKNGDLSCKGIMNLQIRFLSKCFCFKATYNAIYERMSVIFFDLCFPLLCYEDDEMEKWKNDPVEYLKSDLYDFSNILKPTVINLIENATKVRGKDFILPFFSFILGILEKRSASGWNWCHTDSDDRRAEGSLFMMGNIMEKLVARKEEIPLLSVMQKYVLPELSSSNPFLRKRACWLLKQFLDKSKKEEQDQDYEFLICSFLKMLDLCKDPELPVRFEAAVSLDAFFSLEHAEEKKDSPLRKQIVESMSKIMDSLFQVGSEFQHSRVTENLHVLISYFADHIPQHATGLIQRSSDSLLQLDNTRQKECLEEAEGVRQSLYDDFLCSSSTSLSLLSVIRTITITLSSLSFASPEIHHIYLASVPHLFPVLDRFISPRETDEEVVGDVVVILSYVLCHVSLAENPSLWKYYEIFYHELCVADRSTVGWGTIIYDRLVLPIACFACKDPETFCTKISKTAGKTYKACFQEIVAAGLQNDECYEVDALELISLVFEGYFEKKYLLNDLLPYCFGMTLEFFQNEKQKQRDQEKDGSSRFLASSLSCQAFDPVIIRVLCSFISYDVSLFSSVVQSTTHGKDIFQALQSYQTLKAASQKRRLILAMACIIDKEIRQDDPNSISHLDLQNILEIFTWASVTYFEDFAKGNNEKNKKECVEETLGTTSYNQEAVSDNDELDNSDQESYSLGDFSSENFDESLQDDACLDGLCQSPVDLIDLKTLVSRIVSYPNIRSILGEKTLERLGEAMTREVS